MQTRGVRGQKIPKNANVICERPLIVKSLQKEQNSTNLPLWPPICRNKTAITPKWFNSLDTNSTEVQMGLLILNITVPFLYFDILTVRPKVLNRPEKRPNYFWNGFLDMALRWSWHCSRVERLCPFHRCCIWCLAKGPKARLESQKKAASSIHFARVKPNFWFKI